KTSPKQALWVETYLAPPPPSQGKIIGLDCHPDTFTAAVFVGQTPHDARKLGSRENLGLRALLGWAAKEFGPQDLFLLESFTLKLHKLALALGAPWRRQLQLGDTLPACIHTLRSRALQPFSPPKNERSKTNRFAGGSAPPNPAPLAAAGVRGELPVWLACASAGKNQHT
ncbi:MAG: hypothetical protein WBL39_00140, partial [Terrimicrobiaceae bacterium]